MFVLTIDQRKSTGNRDMVADFMKRYAPETDGFTRPFQRTAGDEFQGVLHRADLAVEIAIRAAASGLWHVGLGQGRAQAPLPAETRAGNGEVFANARDAVERAKKVPAHLAYTAPAGRRHASLIEANLQLLARIAADRTDRQQHIGETYALARSQKAAAEKLQISQPAVSLALSSGFWQESQRVLTETINLLEIGEEA